MSALTPGGQAPRLVTLPNNLQAWLIDGRYIPRIAGGDGTDDPPKPDEGLKVDPLKPGANDDDFDKERALATIRKLRETEKTAKANATELEALRAKVKAADDASKTETERLAAKVAELEGALTSAQVARQDALIRAAIDRAANAANAVDADAVYLLLDRSDVTIGDDGSVKGADKAVKDLLTAKPYLVKSDNGTTPNGSRSVPPTPKANGKAQTMDELVEEKYKALQGSGAYTRM